MPIVTRIKDLQEMTYRLKKITDLNKSISDPHTPPAEVIAACKELKKIENFVYLGPTPL